MPPSSDYNIPNPSKVKLKETKPETASRLYRKEQRRMRREADRIARANADRDSEGKRGSTGVGYSPPRENERGRNMDGSVSPPRYGPHAGRRRRGDEGERDAHDNRHEDWASRMAWLEAEALGSNPFAGWGGGMDDMWGNIGGLGGVPGFGGIGQRIPSRFRPMSTSSSSARRDAAAEVSLSGGPVPPLNEMTEEEYTRWVRDGMFKLKHRSELDDLERHRAARREAARAKEVERELERERNARDEARRIEKLKRARSAQEETRRRIQRSTWRVRVGSLVGTDDDVVVVNLTFNDIPWPLYRPATTTEDVEPLLGPDDLTLDRVRDFLFALADDESSQSSSKVEDARRKVLRDAIRLFHPDRFYARVLPRVAKVEQAKVKEGVETCSRLINELLTAR